MIHSILIGVFPLILVVYEWGLRVALGTDSTAFIGPTLATAALSCLMPLTRPLRRAGLTFVHLNRQALPGPPTGHILSADTNVAGIAWGLILVGLFAWEAACYFSLRHPELNTLSMPTHAVLGACAYLTSLTMNYFARRTYE